MTLAIVIGAATKCAIAWRLRRCSCSRYIEVSEVIIDSVVLSVAVSSGDSLSGYEVLVS